MARDLVAKVVVKADVKSAERSIVDLEKSLDNLGAATKAANAASASSAQKTAASTQASIKKTASEANKAIGSIHGKTVHIIGDSKSVSSAAKKAASDLEAVKGKSVKIEADGSRATAAIKKVQNAFKSLRAPAAVRINADTSQATAAITRLKAAAESTKASFATVQAGLSKAMVPVAAATATIYGLKKAFDAVKEGATLDAQTEALKRNVEAQGVAWDGYIAKLAKVSQAQVANADIVRAASSAMLLGIPAEKMSELMEVAAASAVATGRTISESFNDLAVGIGRASPMILDNLGLVVKLGPVYQEYAASIDTTVEALTAEEKKLALLNSILEVGKGRVELFSGAQSEAAKATAELSASLQNQSDEIKTWSSDLASSVAVAVKGVEDLGTAEEYAASKLGIVVAAQEQAVRSASAWRAAIELATGDVIGFSAELGRLAIQHGNEVAGINAANKAAADYRFALDSLNDSASTLTETQKELVLSELNNTEVMKLSKEASTLLAKANAERMKALEKESTIQERVTKIIEEQNVSKERALVIAVDMLATEEASRDSLKKTNAEMKSQLATLSSLSEGFLTAADVSSKFTGELGILNRRQEDLNSLLEKGEISAAKFAVATADVQKQLSILAGAAEAAGVKVEGLYKALDRGADAATKAAAAEAELAEKIKELGILTGGEVAEAQEEHIRLLDTQARLTGINSIEYERLAGALSNEVRELRESTTAQDALNLAQAEGGTAAGGYATSVIKSSDALRDFGNIAAGTQRQVEAMADSMRNAQGIMLQNGSRLPTAPGGGMGGGVGGGTFSGFTPISEFTDSQWATYSRLTGVTKSMWHTQNSQLS